MATQTSLESKMIKSMIEMALSVEDADYVITKFTPHKDIRDKLQFLYDTFRVMIVGRCGEEVDEETDLEIDYEASLTAIINKKWR